MPPKPIDYGSYSQIISQGKRLAQLPDVYYDSLPQELRRISFSVSGVHKLSTIKDILESLNRAEEKGLTFEQWSEQFSISEFQDFSKARRETVFRTHMATQYNNGRLQVAFNSDELIYLKYQAILDDRTRPNHAANDGVVRPVDDPFWDTNTPPLGYNCRCFVLNLSARDLEDSPPTPDQAIDSQALAPDRGFNFNKRNMEKSYDDLFRARAGDMPTSIRQAAIARFLEKGNDVDAWWEENKKQFTKPKDLE